MSHNSGISLKFRMFSDVSKCRADWVQRLGAHKYNSAIIHSESGDRGSGASCTYKTALYVLSASCSDNVAGFPQIIQ